MNGKIGDMTKPRASRLSISDGKSLVGGPIFRVQEVHLAIKVQTKGYLKSPGLEKGAWKKETRTKHVDRKGFVFDPWPFLKHTPKKNEGNHRKSCWKRTHLVSHGLAWSYMVYNSGWFQDLTAYARSGSWLRSSAHLLLSRPAKAFLPRHNEHTQQEAENHRMGPDLSKPKSSFRLLARDGSERGFATKG